MLSSSKIEEVSQNCFVLDVVKFKKNEEVSQNCFVFDVDLDFRFSVIDQQPGLL